ncbi:hypothetical protein [Streptosporangium subroseum]|nr:hypothetical protein OHB15_25070 [Streptosporangium subroseum]
MIAVNHFSDSPEFHSGREVFRRNIVRLGEYFGVFRESGKVA